MTTIFEKVEREGSCEKHGQYRQSVHVINGVERPTTCLTCALERSAAEDEREEREEAERAYRDRVSSAGIPSKFSHVEALGAVAPPQVLAWLAKVEAKASTGPLVIVGPVGVGKTHLAVSALKALLRRWRGAYVSAIDHGRRVRETWSRQGEHTERSLLEYYAGVWILVLDELGATRPIDEPIVQDLICARYDSGRMPQTILITNLAPKSLPAALGERAADRIKEGSTVVTLAGSSRRKPLS